MVVVENDVWISSWFDVALGHRIPDPERFGTSWLHGVTIYVPDPEQTTVSVDGVPVRYFTRNCADALGGPSITIVDSSTRRPSLHGIPAVENSADMKLEIRDACGPIEITVASEPASP